MGLAALWRIDWKGARVNAGNSLGGSHCSKLLLGYGSLNSDDVEKEESKKDM